MGVRTFCIVGGARSGKDFAAEFWAEHFGLSHKSSSVAAAEIFIYDRLKEKYGYSSFEECFLDRMNHRAEWHDLICQYNEQDKARLAKEILKSSQCYVGMRSSDEIKECKKQGIFDLIIWIDASDRVPPEDKSSFNIDISDADIIVDNNGTEEEYTERLNRLGKFLFNKTKENE